jgi:propanol-preferring alcohol dehydrogenase
MNCRRGWDINCQQKWGTYGLDRPGAMQDFMVVRSQDCVVVPPNISLAEAAYYTCGAGTGYLALKRGAFGLGDTVAIIGLGPVGLAGGFFASLTGARVIGIDTIESRCTFAHQKGISIVCNPRTDDAVSTVLGATGGQGADVVLETSGSAAGRILALDVAAIHGRVVCVGFADTSTVLDVQRQIIQKQLDVRGAWMFPLPELQRMLDDVSRQQISIQSLITDTYRIEDGAEAWSAFDQGSLGKTLITWTD